MSLPNHSDPFTENSDRRLTVFVKQNSTHMGKTMESDQVNNSRYVVIDNGVKDEEGNQFAIIMNPDYGCGDIFADLDGKYTSVLWFAEELPAYQSLARILERDLRFEEHSYYALVRYCQENNVQ